MGLLDDAIRDHLDLKRRRGADPTEVERAERDALGPVRRTPEPLADDLPGADDETALYDDAAPVGGPVAAEEPGAPLFEEPFDGEEPFDDDDLLAEDDDEWLEDEEHPPLAFEAQAEAPEAAAPPAPAPPAAEPEPEPAPAVPPPSPAPPPEPHPAPPAGDETVEFHVEDALAAEDPPTGEEDPLEETPGFLEDTPDHDRLWFEQRPPKDFDFDG